MRASESTTPKQCSPTCLLPKCFRANRLVELLLAVDGRKMRCELIVVQHSSYKGNNGAESNEIMWAAISECLHY